MFADIVLCDAPHGNNRLMLGLELKLSFNGFEIVSLFASILLLNYLVVHGLSTWYDLGLVIDHVFATCIRLIFATRISESLVAC